MNNLKTIYAAIEAYRRDHNNEAPNWFTDLVPDYLPDVNVLVCPLCLRSGKTEDARLADPSYPSSYLYEFCPIPLGNFAPNNPTATRREWKMRQMAIVGHIVPLVRCRTHRPLLNLAFDGRIYESTPAWETMLTNTIDPQSISIARMFAAPQASVSSGGARKNYPQRDPKTRAQLLDLTAFFNAGLTDSWHGNENSTGNELGGMTAGVQLLEGVEYDVRGIIQLGSKDPGGRKFPGAVNGIKVNQVCHKLHFLHSAAWGHAQDEGRQVGSYVLHFASNNTRVEVPIVYGKDVRDWHYSPTEKEAAASLHMVWKGENAVSKRAGSYIRLFETTWTNPLPELELELESIDFVSNMSQVAPFLVAITVE